MRGMELSRPVAAPADVVWEVVTDIEGSPSAISGIDRVEMLAGAGSFGIGTRWRETRTLFGRTATEEMEVTGVDEGRSYTVSSDSAGTHYEWTLSVTPVSERSSQLALRFGGEPGTTLAKVMAATVGRLFEGATRKALRKDLDDMAEEAERRGTRTQA